MTTPSRRRLDPSPDELQTARGRLDDFLAKDAADSAAAGMRVSEDAQWRAARSYTLGALSWLLDDAARKTGDDMIRSVREARAANAALEAWTAEQEARDA